MSTLDRDKAREVLAPWMEHATEFGWTEVLDALEACLVPATIDRDALVSLLDVLTDWRADLDECDRWADRILALVQPDPRLAKLEALCDEVDQHNSNKLSLDWRLVTTDAVRAILRGDA